VLAAVSTLVGAALFELRAQVAGQTLPAELSDAAFWQMVVDFSEPSGVFRSDNFVSNELTYQDVVPELKRRVSPDSVYLGVGPDQNFTYIAATKPGMAFIVDIRRQNLVELLLYKAVIEMADDRAEFLSRLFSRPRPPGLDHASSAQALFEAFEGATASDALFQTNVREIEWWLVNRHKFPLATEDLQSLEYVYSAFFSEGPSLRYSFPRQRAARWFPTYAELMLATDANGTNHSYMASEENFRTLRTYERKNLIVPIVGDFAGDKALRAVARYLTQHNATVSSFYTSNVEQYLFQDNAWRRYYASVATLPLDEKSAFIRAYFDVGFMYPPGIITPDLHSVQYLDPVLAFLDAVGSGQVRSYQEVVSRRK